MNIQVRSSNGISLIPIESILYTDRKIFIEEEINSRTSLEFIKQLMLLCRQDSKAPVDVLINSPGGVITAGLAMYDCIQSCKTPIRMICIGSAASMAAIIFAGGNNGRYMLPNSEIMIHEPLLGSPVEGNASSIYSVSEKLMKRRKQTNQILAKHTGKTEKEIEDATNYDHYMTAEESIEFGLADGIIGFDEI